VRTISINARAEKMAKKFNAEFTGELAAAVQHRSYAAGSRGSGNRFRPDDFFYALGAHSLMGK
jgi:hypothetical protein